MNGIHADTVARDAIDGPVQRWREGVSIAGGRAPGEGTRPSTGYFRRSIFLTIRVGPEVRT